MAGHLFIVRGDLTKLACDAWLMPTGFNVKVERYWLQPEPKGFQAALRSLRTSLPGAWLSGERRVLPVPEWPTDRSRPWLANIQGQPFNELYGVVRQFIDAVLSDNSPPQRGRSRHLLALPVISTGKGGGARFKGQVIAALVRSLLQLTRDCDVDLVLVTHTAAALAAAQKARLSQSYIWDGLPRESLKKAKTLADVSRRQGLALFLGAGVSCSAGLPSWNGLLRNLAQDIGITSPTELSEFNNLDVLDRGSILERRFRNEGKSLRLAIANIFSRSWDHSLLHAFLACLPASEAITQNYDRLFEVAAMGAERPVAVLPYTPGQTHSRWLLKMHGCVSVPDDIVIQREDYLRYTERRAALTGIVQATLLTRSMLFVGFSLRDGNFHRAVDDVRRALLGQKQHGLGTALFLAPSPLTSELWHSELDIVDFQQPGDPDDGQVGPAARRLEIFLDCLLAHCGSNTDHLLDPTFSHLLTKQEHEIKEALLKISERLPMADHRAEAWDKVEELLHSLGWQSQKEVP